MLKLGQLMYGQDTKREETTWKFCVQTNVWEVLHLKTLSVG